MSCDVDCFQAPYWDESFIPIPFHVGLLKFHALIECLFFLIFFLVWDSNFTIDSGMNGVPAFPRDISHHLFFLDCWISGLTGALTCS